MRILIHGATIVDGTGREPFKGDLLIKNGRIAAMGNLRRQSLSHLTLPELSVFKKLVADSIAEGAFGLSFGLGYLHSRGTPFNELLELARIQSPHTGFLSLHLRHNTAKLGEGIEEAIRLA